MPCRSFSSRSRWAYMPGSMVDLFPEGRATIPRPQTPANIFIQSCLELIRLGTNSTRKITPWSIMRTQSATLHVTSWQMSWFARLLLTLDDGWLSMTCLSCFDFALSSIPHSVTIGSSWKAQKIKGGCAFRKLYVYVRSFPEPHCYLLVSLASASIWHAGCCCILYITIIYILLCSFLPCCSQLKQHQQLYTWGRL